MKIERIARYEDLLVSDFTERLEEALENGQYSRATILEQPPIGETKSFVMSTLCLSFLPDMLNRFGGAMLPSIKHLAAGRDFYFSWVHKPTLTTKDEIYLVSAKFVISFDEV